MKALAFVEYIWLDGTVPEKKMRSKCRLLSINRNPTIEDFPKWNFDGSSTNQASGNDSDCSLVPVHFVVNPICKGDGFLVLCEVFNYNGTASESNSRYLLRKLLEDGRHIHEPWIGFEQEYTMFKRNIPLGWPEHGFPAPQGPYYCGVGSEQIFGRDLACEHAVACVEAGLMYYGMNAEVMPGQWEFQIGYRGCEEETADVLVVADHLWIARWLLHRLSEKYDVHISLDNKPVKGDWNGAGMHANFSTKSMRSPEGLQVILDAIDKLRAKHKDHIKYYGDKLEERLTGLHETSAIDKFSAGNADRGSSVRIPASVYKDRCGYFEDRRPGANADPYEVAMMLVSTVC